MAKKNVFDILTEKVLGKLENGDIIWRKSFKTGVHPINYFSEKVYNGVNLWLLEPNGQYATYKQIIAAGGKIKEDETKNYEVVFFFTMPSSKKDEDEDEDEKKKDEKKKAYSGPIFRYYRVYNVLTQVEGLEPKNVKDIRLFTKTKEKLEDITPKELGNKLVEDYLNSEKIKTNYANEPSEYYPTNDSMVIFDKNASKDVEDFNSWLSNVFVEIAHSTGTQDRLKRSAITSFKEDYSAQEYLASEMATALLMSELTLETEFKKMDATRDIDFWKEELSKNPRAVAYASSQAVKIKDYIINSLNGKLSIEEEK